MSKEKIQNLIQYPEIFRLPIIVTQKDLKIEFFNYLVNSGIIIRI